MSSTGVGGAVAAGSAAAPVGTAGCAAGAGEPAATAVPDAVGVADAFGREDEAVADFDGFALAEAVGAIACVRSIAAGGLMLGGR